MLHKALEGAIISETFPKTTVDVFALVLESGGSKFSISFVKWNLFYFNYCKFWLPRKENDEKKRM
jgi:hypothetical protein